MGLFGKKPKAGSSGNSDVKFLMKADEEYVRAFQTRLLGNLDRYLTRLCCTKLMERIRMSDKEVVGMMRYRKTEWVKQGDSVYVKNVSYEDVNMGCGVKVPLGDPYQEYWSLTTENNSKKVSEIRRQSC